MSALVVSGCAPAWPMLVGGRTVPSGRSDIAAGASYRIPVGDMVATTDPAPTQRLIAFGAPGGAVPLVALRHGLGPRLDFGLAASGSTVTAEVRGREPVSSFSLVYGIQALGGLAAGDGLAGRVGGTVPVALAIDVFSVVQAWFGLRVGIEHVRGDLDGPAGSGPLELTGLRTGGALGIAVGFRRFFVFIELAADHEAWWGTVTGTSIERNGLVLTPAFALAVRL